MARDPERPLLRLSEARKAGRTAKGRRARFPPNFSRDRQQEKIGPKFDRIRDAVDASGDALIAIRDDPSALVPETLIVFELRSSLVTFSEAIAAIPGLELIAEDDGEITDDEGVAIPGHLYAVFSNTNAMRELLSLWTRWRSGEALPRELKTWEKVFACLSDLRRWGPKDRVSQVHADAIERAYAGLDDGELAHLEIELIFRHGTEAEDARARVLAEFAERGVREIRSARYEGFAFDCILIELTVGAARSVALRLQESVAGINDAFRVRPQSIGYGSAGADRDVAPPRTDPPATGNPIVAVFDGIPIANHPYFANRLILDDPDNLTARSIGARTHGTAMASLVIFGDLNADAEIINRPAYLRPFLVDRDNFPDVENERTLPDRILIDDLVQATRRIKVGEGQTPAQAPDVVVINISFGIPDLIFDETMSPLARCLDWLSFEYGVLFVVSAGNASEPLVVSAYADDVAFLAANSAERTENVLVGVRNIRSSQKFLSPAEAMNALTVGALHADQLGTPPTVGTSYDPLPEGRLPSILSRMGLGYAKSAKPDIIAPGGRLRVHLRPTESPIALNRTIRPSRLGGLRVVAGMDPIAGAQLGWSGATSASAAMTTHALHKIHDALEEAYPQAFINLPSDKRALLLKTLTVHRSRRPSNELELIERVFGGGQPRHASKMKADIARLYGFGELDEDASTSCAFNRATAWATGDVQSDQGVMFSLPLPLGLNAQTVAKRITATVCWFSPILPGRQGYRAIRLVVDEGEDDFTGAIRSLGVKVSSDQLDSNGTRRGTVFHRSWDGARAANFQAGQSLEIKVTRMPDTISNAVSFALAVTIEADANIPIYEQVLQGINVALRPRVRQQVAPV